MFEDILGNDDVKKYLTNCIENKNFSHSYIFSGIKGVGKYSFAKDFAKCILEDSMMQDYYELGPDGKSIKVSQIRELQNVINIKPTFSKKSVYIIDDADLMTIEAQNSLLKTLEEPPEYAVIILIVHNERSILSTVKSRCVNIKFSKLSDKDIKKYLDEYGDIFYELTYPILILENKKNGNSSEIIIDGFTNSWYIDIIDDSSTYNVTYARKVSHNIVNLIHNNILNVGEIIHFAKSNNIVSPNGHILYNNSNNVVFKNIKTNTTYTIPLTNILQSSKKIYNNIANLKEEILDNEHITSNMGNEF